ncbi:MAG: ABC transporter ATP-binding protein [Hyphomicrobiales bacterium]|nr:ABC transporter ATP-binding protein [Hyphomicrobiales bacterium]
MAKIALENLEKRFGSFVAVESLSLEIADGEFLALLGPSGCGKTTILRMISGLTEATRGRIHFGARDVTGLPPYARNIGLVFQGYALFPHMTVAENVAFGLEMRALDRGEIGHRVHSALETVQLAGLASRLPRQLSGGQQQRVALARAIVIRPDALLLDEPLSALDAKLRQELRQEIRRLQRSLGITTICVTHDQEEALSLATRLVVMHHGRIEQIGTPSDLYERPASRFVAEFIGKSNFLDGRVVAKDEFVTKSGFVFRFQRQSARASSHEASSVGFRPEKIEIGRARNAALANHVEGTVDAITYLGATTEYEVRLPSLERLTVHAGANPVEPIGIGDEVTLSWSSEATFVV